MKRLFMGLSIGMLACVAPSGVAYKESTHDAITRAAAEQSLANVQQARVLGDLFLGESLNDSRYRLPKVDRLQGGVLLTPLQLIAAGVREEDEQDRALNHFFDTQQDGIPLTIVFKEWGDASPRWALEDTGGVAGQDFSYRDARGYLYLALAGATEMARKEALGKVFESLGHVIHHLQDMAQPQHVRNDDHCDETVPYFIFSVYSFYYASPSRCQALGRYHPSAYEAYVRDMGVLPLSGYPVPEYGTFDVPRKFWQEAGKGVAEFTSNNFVTVGTNFTLDVADGRLQVRSDENHAAPNATAGRLESVNVNDPALTRRVTEPMPMAGDVAFLQTQVIDAYRIGLSQANPYTSTLSIWYDSVRLSSGEVLATPSKVFTLNSVNYEAAAQRLLPRAAAYSTGLINYFFRGRIGIELPEEGVYGIVDHATTYAAGQGFDKLKLKLHNASPDGVKPGGEAVPQTMQGGTLVAVAKYTLNSCYLPDLSGDFSVRIDTGEVIYPPCTLDQYFAGEEQISQSAAILAASLDKVGTDVEFDFSSQPIPINARDLRIQVVYTGQLGAEADGIAFGGRDISEPTHLMVYNNSDYYAVDGTFYTPAQIRGDAALAQRVQGQNIDPQPLSTVALMVVPGHPLTHAAGPVAVNGYVRAAVLADIDRPFSVGVLTRFEGGAFIDTTFDGIWANTTDLRTEPAYITPFGIYRGARGHFVDVVFKANNSTPLGDEELVTMSGRSVPDPGPTPIPLRF